MRAHWHPATSVRVCQSERMLVTSISGIKHRRQSDAQIQTIGDQRATILDAHAPAVRGWIHKAVGACVERLLQLHRQLHDPADGRGGRIGGSEAMRTLPSPPIHPLPARRVAVLRACAGARLPEHR